MNLAQLLLTPCNTTHRQYEALRAYLVDRLPGPRWQNALATPWPTDRARLRDGQIRHLFRDFVDATASINIGEREISVHFQKRAQPFITGGRFGQSRCPNPLAWEQAAPLGLRLKPSCGVK